MKVLKNIIILSLFLVGIPFLVKYHEYQERQNLLIDKEWNLYKSKHVRDSSGVKKVTSDRTVTEPNKKKDVLTFRSNGILECYDNDTINTSIKWEWQDINQKVIVLSGEHLKVGLKYHISTLKDDELSWKSITTKFEGIPSYTDYYVFKTKNSEVWKDGVAEIKE